MKQKLQRRFVFLLIGLQVLLAAVVIAGALHYARQMRSTVLNEQLNLVARNVQGVEEHLTQTLYLAGLTLANLPELSGYRAGQPLDETWKKLERIQRQMPVLRSLSFADRNGRILASSVAANVGRQLDLAPLLPQAPLERTQLMRLGAPWEGRDFADGRPTHADSPADPRVNSFFPLALSLPGDTPLVAIAAVNSDYFLNRIVGNFETSQLRISVVDYNGILLLGNHADLRAGNRMSDTALLARVKQEEIGQQNDDSAAVLTAFRASRAYPFLVVGHAQHAAVLAKWQEEIRSGFIFTVLALAATLLVTGFLTLRLMQAFVREGRLHEVQQLAARVFENSNDGIIIADAKTTILSVNPAFERMTGYPAAAVIGQTPRLLASGLHDKEFYARIWQELQATGTWQGEIINRCRDGSTLTGWQTIIRIRDEQGNPSGFYGFFHDLTEMRRSEQLIRQLSTAVEQSPSSIVITSLESTIEYVNPQFTRVTGYTPEEVIGRNPRFLQSGQTPAETFRSLWTSLTAGENWEGEFINRRKDGSCYYEHATLAPIRDAAGRIVRYLAIQHDITARKQAEAALIEARDAAEAANRAKTSFLANMSHELRTPMNGVMGMLELARRRMQDPKGLQQLDTARAAADNLLAVLNDILDIAKIEAERVVLEEAPLHIGALVDNLVGMFAHKAGEKGLSFEADIPAPLARLPLTGDPLRLGQILLNLASNAVKFTHRGGITVRGQLLEEAPAAVLVRFEVIDSGIGIDTAAQARLFTAFEQADNSMARKYGGTGLGLAISKRLAQLMGGEIGVISAPEQGSTFWFTVRLARRDTDAVAPAPTFTPGMAEERLREKYAGVRVLLTEDDPVTQEVSLGMLEAVNLGVDLAENGQQALELARSRRYALILMDMQMPVLNGVDAARAIRADSLNQHTPILAMTANAFEEDRESCIAAGMNDHIAKPVHPDILYAALLRWLA